MPAITSESSSNYTAAMRLILPASRAPTTATANSSSPSSIASVILSSFLPQSIDLPTLSPPSVGNLLAASSSNDAAAAALLLHDDSSSFPEAMFDVFFDEDDDLFGSPLPFDASENGLWNGRFVPPPPRPPFLMDEPVLSDGLTTCDLCSWAMPTKSTFIFEGTIEKASELGWPLTLIIVSVLSAILGAIIMITVVRCRRKKSSNNRNETHVQWWSRNKRPNNNNHLRRSNIYTAHPADSIRGLHQPAGAASTSSSPVATTSQQQHTLHHNHGQNHHQLQHEYHQQQHPQLQHQFHQQNSASPTMMLTMTTTITTTTTTTTPTAPSTTTMDSSAISMHQQDPCNWPNVTTLIVASS